MAFNAPRLSTYLPSLHYAQIRDNFASELHKASKGQQSSLPFIRNPLPKEALMKHGVFQAIVIGGTHYESHLARLESDGTLVHLSEIKKGRLPLLATKEIFLQAIQKILDPSIQYLSLNLAFPLHPLIKEGKLDGEFAYATKEHTFHGLIGKPIGQTIEAYIQKTQGRDIKVTVANDTVCLVLAGLQDKDVVRETLAGAIVGSGFNIGFFSDNDTIINIESANFNRFTQTPTGKLIDAASETPGRNSYEKEVSGMYLYQHYNLLRKQLDLHAPRLNDSKELSQLAASGSGVEAELAQGLMQRAAALVAAQMAGIYLFKGKPKSMTFVVEGSVFKKGWRFEQMVHEALEKLAISHGAIRFLHIENSSLGGAVSLVTTKRGK